MRSPEAARAIPGLVRSRVLTPEQAAPLLAAARGERVSIRGELRSLTGLAVLALTTATGLFLESHHEALGPLGIAMLLAVAIVACLFAVARRSPPFTWHRVSAPDWIVDGLLLLAIGLGGAELAWIETRFTPLGADWPWHLLLLSLVTGTLAVRFDSIVGWTLSMSTFAAWRGVAVAPTPGNLGHMLFRGEAELRWNLLFCALVFAVLGGWSERFDRKRHFEPATTFAAALAAGLALVSGLGDEARWPLWTLALAALGVLVARLALSRRRLALFALGALAVYFGLTRFLLELPGAFALGCFWFAASSVCAVALLVVVHRRFRADENS